MDLKFGLSETVSAELKNIFAQYSTIQKVLIFGSRAKGNHRSGSDIDLAVMAATMKSDEFTRLWNGVDQAATIFKVDLIHWDQLQNAGLKQKIVKEGQVFYP